MPSRFKYQNRPSEPSQLYAASIQCYRALLKRFPGQDDAGNYDAIARRYMDLKNWKAALETFAQLNKNYPEYKTNDNIPSHIAYCYKNMGDYQEAIYLYKEIIRKYPEERLYIEGDMQECYNAMKTAQ